jgi:demethylmenaquinone methyltransferase/2-methoxy-6-polyprenyl-1,4-benzoquinol methylase
MAFRNPDSTPGDILQVARSKEEARTSYDRLSRWYDLLTSSEKKITRTGLQHLEPHPGERILEAGFGTGQALIELGRAVSPGGKAVGVDISEGMRQVARKRIVKAGLAETIELTGGDAVHQPFKDEAFEAVFMSFTLELFDTPDIPLVLTECRRVLRKGGRLGIVALVRENLRSVRVYEWFHVHMPALVDCRPILAREAVEAAGLEVSTSEIKRVWGLPVEVIIARRI